MNLRTRYHALRRRLESLTDPEKQWPPALALSILYVLAITVFGLKPILFEVLELKQEVLAGKKAEEILSRKISNLDQATGDLNRIRSDLNLLNRSLPENKDVSHLLETLSQIFGSHNLSLDAIRFEGPKPSKDQKIFILPFNLQASGDYQNVLLTLDDLEKNPRPIDVRRIAIEIPSRGDKKFLRVTIALETYFLRKVYL